MQTDISVPNINTGASLRENIERAIRLWVDTVGLVEPLLLPWTDPVTGLFFEGHESCQQFIDRITAQRSNAYRGLSGAIMTKPDTNPDNRNRTAELAFIGEIPPLLFTIMERAFGSAWQTHPDVWREFRRLFQIGNLNIDSHLYRKMI